MHSRTRRSRAVLLLWGCVAFFALVNSLSFPSLMLGDVDGVLAATVFFPACCGAIAAQMALHALWSVLAPLHWIRRSLVGATSVLVLYGLLVTGWAVGAFHNHLQIVENLVPFAIGLLCLPLLLLAAQAPLWIVRIWFRWRIAHRDEGPSACVEPWRIRDLMIATAAIAVALAAAQLSQAIDAPSGDGSIVGLAVAALIIIVISGIIVLPLAAATLHARRLLIALALVLFLDIAIVGGYLLLIVTFAKAHVDWTTFVTIPAAVGGFFVSLTTPMLIARGFGYRLVWGQRPICSGDDGNQMESKGL